MTILPELTAYYRGERLEAVLLTVFGLCTVSIVVAIRVAFSENQMLKGLSYPLAFLGLFTLCAGAFNTCNNTHRLAQLPARYAADPVGLVRAEMARFEGTAGVNRWWVPLKVTWATCIVVGMMLSFNTRVDRTSGIAIGLIAVGGMGFLIDGFAHHRASVYTAALIRESRAN